MTESSIGSLISAATTVFIVLIFVRAVWHKLGAFTEFTGFVADYKLFGDRLVQPVSIAIVAAELATVLLQLVPGAQAAGLVVAATLLVVYAGAMAVNIRRGRTSIECGCGGAVQPLSWTLVGRNALLALLATGAATLGPYALDGAGAMTAIACGVSLWIAFLLAEQVIANSSAARLSR